MPVSPLMEYFQRQAIMTPPAPQPYQQFGGVLQYPSRPNATPNRPGLSVEGNYTSRETPPAIALPMEPGMPGPLPDWDVFEQPNALDPYGHSKDGVITPDEQRELMQLFRMYQDAVEGVRPRSMVPHPLLPEFT